MTSGTRPHVRRTLGAAPNARPGTGLKLNLDALRLSIFLLMIVNVSRIHQHFGFIARLRPAVVLVMLAAIYAFANPRFLRREPIFSTWPEKLMAALGIFACIAAPFGISLGASASFILQVYSKVLIFAFLVVMATRKTEDLFTFVWAYVISAGVLVWMSLFVFGLTRYDSGVSRLANLYSYDANDAGLVLVVAVPLTLLAFQASSRRGKVISGLVLAGIGGTIARTGSRGAFLGLATVGITLLFLLNSVSVGKRLGFLIVTVVGLAIAAPQGYWEQMRTILYPTADYNWRTTDGRRQVAQRGINYMLDHPIFGLGVNNFWRAECLESDKAASRVAGTGIRCTPPHNSYVQAGAELGIPGLILWCSLVFGGVAALARLRRRLPKSWLKGDPEERFLYLSVLYIGLALVGFAVSSFFLTFAWEDVVYILAAFMAGLYVCLDAKVKRAGAVRTVASPPSPRRRGMRPATGFIAPPPQ